MSTASIRRALLHRSTILSTCLATLLVYAFLTGPSITSLTSTSTLSLDELTSALKSTTDKLTPSPPATSTPSTIAAGDAAALRDLCSRTTWRPNLALHCTSRCGPDRSSICGGLNNARDRLQTCARLAVDAGAGTLVVPSIAARSELALYAVDPAQVEGAGEPVVLCADEWFSVERLRGVLGGACPQMRVEVACPGEGIGGGNGFKGVAGLVGADADDVVEMPWRALGGERYGASAGQTFRQAVDEVLGLDRLQEMAKPVLVDYGDPYFAWNYTLGGETYTIFKDLFRAVDYSTKILALGERVTQSPRLRNGAYVGVHLRAEADWPPNWGTLDEQTQMYVAELQRLRERDGLDSIAAAYVSCGNRDAISHFREAVEPLGIAVLDKWTVFEEDWPEGLQAVEKLSFDQKAVVELVPLTRARYFLGLRLSSMSVVVAQTRTLDEEGDFFENHVDNGAKPETSGRTMTMSGNENTRLLTISGIEDW